jgi:BASS family bile acid:Na+ symporter
MSGCATGVALTSGLVENFFIPLLFVVVLSQVLRVWHNPEEVQNICLGLALVASMPNREIVDRLVS